MAITQIRYKYKRAGTRFNSVRQVYVGWRTDVYINGKRCRSRRFPTKADAESLSHGRRDNQRQLPAGL